MLTKSKVKYIQSLGQKKFRDLEGRYIAEGPKLVAELLFDSNNQVEEIFALQYWVEEHSDALKNINYAIVTEPELEKISLLTTPNEVVAIVKKPAGAGLPDVNSSFILALDDIRDPGNLGTIIRIADWFGITQIVCSTACADCYNPKVIQATMGSIARVMVFYTDLHQWLTINNKANIYAAVLDGQNIDLIKKTGEGVLLIGNESRGISPELLRIASTRITIPRKGKAESLNAAIATGIILSHLC